jgi:uncharacterized protein (TIGR02266 family)
MAKSILVVGLERKLFEEIDPLLNRSHFTVDRMARGKSGLALCEQVPFDLIIAVDPLPDIDITEFLTVVREKGMPTATSHLLALGVDERLDVLRQHVRGKDSVVLAVTEPQAVLEEVAARLLGVAARRAVRFMVRLRVDLASREQAIMCQTDNVSLHGMLVRTSSPLPVGTRLGFEYNLPGDRHPIQGEAEVVRHTAPQIGEVPGMGLRSLALKGDGAARLEAFLGKLDGGR